MKELITSLPPSSRLSLSYLDEIIWTDRNLMSSYFHNQLILLGNFIVKQLIPYNTMFVCPRKSLRSYFVFEGKEIARVNTPEGRSCFDSTFFCIKNNLANRSTVYCNQTGYLYWDKRVLKILPITYRSDDNLHLSVHILPMINYSNEVYQYYSQLQNTYPLLDNLEYSTAFTENFNSILKHVVQQGTCPIESVPAQFIWNKKIQRNIHFKTSLYAKTKDVVYFDVESNEKLLEYIPPQPGTPGIDLDGNAIPVENYPEIKIKTGPNIHKQKENSTLFFAVQDGVLTITDNSISVESQVLINGDLNSTRRNINTVYDVHVSGNVCSNKTIKSKSSITIMGVVENGVFIQAGGEIKIHGGVFGNKTRLASESNVHLKFIQDSYVRSSANIEIERYCINPKLYALGKIMILGKGLQKGRSTVQGGIINGCQGIEARFIGSKEIKTTLCSGIDLEINQKHKSLKESLSNHEREILKLQSKIPTKNGTNTLPRMIQKYGEEYRLQLKRNLTTIKDYLRIVSVIKEKFKPILELLEKSKLKDSTIITNDGILGEVCIQIENSSRTINYIKEKLGSTVYKLNNVQHIIEGDG